jgi:ribosomal protein S18 acetylase RimI-like enzyme/GAF domain-containing protein
VRETEAGKRPLWGEPSTEDTGSATGHDALAVRLVELARELQQGDDPALTLERVVQGAVALIPGVQSGSISVVVDRRGITSVASSGMLPTQVDALQAETGQGPCLDAAFEHQTVRVADMRTETRWPAFARRAWDIGAGSMLSFQLFVDGDTLGALNLYSSEPNAFDDESEHVGLLFAAHAAIAYAAANEQRQLSVALTTRDLIGQAKGVLIERFKITGDQAFALLVSASKDTNIRLRDVADQLVVTGELARAAHRRRTPRVPASGPAIRSLVAGDVDAVVELSLRAWAPISESFAKILGPTIYPLVYPNWSSSQAAAVRAACAGEHVFVADLGDGPVGFVAVVIRDDDPKTAELDMIAVDPTSQRQGVGDALMTYAVDHMRAAGVVVADIATGGDPAHEPARLTYEKAGFTALPLVRYYRAL